MVNSVELIFIQQINEIGHFKNRYAILREQYLQSRHGVMQIGDVREYNSINEALKGVHFIFHAAALKQVPSCEFYPMEAVRTEYEAALPQLMLKLEKLGCSRSVVGLVVPTGYSFNLDGTNIYMTMAVLFIAQATNTDLTWTQQLTLLAVTMLTSKGASGVTGAGFITLAATLAVVPTIPLSGMVLILGIDRFMSECRALTNIVGNGVATVVVSAWEKELDRNKLRDQLKHGAVDTEAETVS